MPCLDLADLLGLKARKAVFVSSCLLCQRECWWEQEPCARMRIWGWGRNCKVSIDKSSITIPAETELVQV